jgi:cytochrome P450 family 135
VPALRTDLSAGPTEPPILQTLRWLLRPISFLESCRRRFGDTFSVRFLGFRTPMVMLSDPEAIRALYGNPAHGLPPGRSLALLPILGSRSLLLLEGREHLARRRLMLPPFHGERMRAYEATVREVVARDVETWPEGEPFSLHPRMQGVTLEVILRAVFGVTDAERRTRLADRVGHLLAETASAGLQFAVLLSRRFGTPDPLDRLQALRGEIDAMLDLEIAERRADPREDILSMLVAARFEGGEPLDDAEIRDQLMTLLLAGHETTATGLAWTFDLLVRHPAVLERLVAEVDAGGQAYVRAVSHRVPATPAGRPAGRAATGRAAPRRRPRAAGRNRCDAGHLARAHPRRPVSRTVRVPARALPRRRVLDLRMDPVRWRRPAMHRRCVRRDGDAGRARGDPAAPDAAGCVGER